MCNQVENKHCNAFWNPIRFHNLKLFGIVSAFFFIILPRKNFEERILRWTEKKYCNKQSERGERQRRTQNKRPLKKKLKTIEEKRESSLEVSSFLLSVVNLARRLNGTQASEIVCESAYYYFYSRAPYIKRSEKEETICENQATYFIFLLLLVWSKKGAMID